MTTVGHFEVASGHTEVPSAVERVGMAGEQVVGASVLTLPLSHSARDSKGAPGSKKSTQGQFFL